ncbi:hypothetical protein [Helicobacter pylori]|uniref:hypothetical protein n=1 Tax=Helicobacter pylori TaxID=210 RepID=UPI001E4E3408|nr:hypothetical protein [Helicobacter pylori]
MKQSVKWKEKLIKNREVDRRESSNCVRVYNRRLEIIKISNALEEGKNVSDSLMDSVLNNTDKPNKAKPNNE